LKPLSVPALSPDE